MNAAPSFTGLAAGIDREIRARAVADASAAFRNVRVAMANAMRAELTPLVGGLPGLLIDMQVDDALRKAEQDTVTRLIDARTADVAARLVAEAAR